MEKNYYQIIGVDKKADLSAIKSAYLYKLKKFHPDIYKGDKVFAEQKTAELTEAYNTLKNTELRAKYDLTIPDKEGQKKDYTADNWLKELTNNIKDFFVKMNDNFTRSRKIKKQIKAKESAKNNKSKEIINYNKNDKLKLNITISIIILIIIIFLLLIILL